LGFLRKYTPSLSGVKRVWRSFLWTLFFPLDHVGVVNHASSVFSDTKDRRSWWSPLHLYHPLGC
jgi:hypothetical protein